MINALTIDVEDYYQVEAFTKVIDRSTWETYPSRVVQNTRRILELLDRKDVRATFFVLGWVAQRQPALVAEIAARGHEIACHGYGHQLVYQLTPDEFSADLRQAVEVIGTACPSAEILGYRAPSFSITDRSLWALEILGDLGFKYDSSIFPIAGHDLYGMPDAPRHASQITARLQEFPVSTVRFAGRNWPVAGGGYFRFFPLWLTRLAIRRINAENQPAIVYLHPWEFDPEQPRVSQFIKTGGRIPWRSRFRHYVNLQKTEERLRRLLDEFQLCPCVTCLGMLA